MSPINTKGSAMTEEKQKVSIRDIAQVAVAAGILSACISLTSTMNSTRKAIDKHNDLISQQISVTRSMHHIQELATAYLEKRKASPAAEESIIEPLPDQ